MRKIVTSLYRDVATAQKAMADLVEQGFDRNDVSLLVNLVARENDPYKKSKTRYSRRGQVDAPMGVLLGLLAGLVIGGVAGAVLSALPSTYPLGTMAGWGAAIGGVSGAISGGILNSSVPRNLGQNLTTVEKAGAALVRVRARDEDLDKARKILREHGAVDVEDRQDKWDESGWEPYDPAAEPMR